MKKATNDLMRTVMSPVLSGHPELAFYAEARDYNKREQALTAVRLCRAANSRAAKRKS